MLTLMKALFALAIIASLTGCAPRITASSPRTVQMTTVLSSPQAALQVAERQCQRQGLHAMLNTKEGANVTFDCVP